MQHLMAPFRMAISRSLNPLQFRRECPLLAGFSRSVETAFDPERTKQKC